MSRSLKVLQLEASLYIFRLFTLIHCQYYFKYDKDLFIKMKKKSQTERMQSE